MSIDAADIEHSAAEPVYTMCAATAHKRAQDRKTIGSNTHVGTHGGNVG